MNYLTDYMAGLRHLLATTAVDCAGSIEDMRRKLATARTGGARIFICGNGGSAATASHFALDLVKNAEGFKAIALSDSTPMLTALANDIGYTATFAAQLESLATGGDVLLAISASGNSRNILAALRAARPRGLWNIGLLGFDGGEAKELCDVSVVVPCNDYALVEDVHMAICHMLTTHFKEGRCGS